MNHCDNSNHHALDDSLEDEASGDEDATALVFVQIIPCRCIPRCACDRDTFHRSTGVHENQENAVGVEHGVHWKVVHQPTDDIVCGSRVNWGRKIDEDGLRDIEILVSGMIAAEASQAPAYREEQAAPECPEGHSPEAIATVS